MQNQGGFLKTLIILAVIGFVGYYVIHDLNIFGFPVRRGIAGIPAPVLKPATGQITLEEIDGYRITADYMYSCDMRGLVVNERHFRESSVIDKLAPVSAILAWGTVAENNDKIDFGWQQPIRGALAWSAKGDAYDAIGGSAAIYQCCTDAYLIPANAALREDFRKIKQGDQLHLTGYLVDVWCQKSAGDGIGIGSGDLAKCIKGEGHDTDIYSVFYVTEIEWLK